MSEFDITSRELLYGLRGVPTKCDFCGKDTHHSRLEPEEGGDWVCHDCMARWEAEETGGCDAN